MAPSFFYFASAKEARVPLPRRLIRLNAQQIGENPPLLRRKRRAVARRIQHHIPLVHRNPAQIAKSMLHNGLPVRRHRRHLPERLVDLHPLIGRQPLNRLVPRSPSLPLRLRQFIQMMELLYLPLLIAGAQTIKARLPPKQPLLLPHRHILMLRQPLRQVPRLRSRPHRIRRAVIRRPSTGNLLETIRLRIIRRRTVLLETSSPRRALRPIWLWPIRLHRPGGLRSSLTVRSLAARSLAVGSRMRRRMSATTAVLKSPASPCRSSLPQEQSDPQAGSLHRPSSHFRSRLRIVHHRRSRSLSLISNVLITLTQSQNLCRAVTYANGVSPNFARCLNRCDPTSPPADPEAASCCPSSADRAPLPPAPAEASASPDR